MTEHIVVSWGCSSVADYLPSMNEVLGLAPSTTQRHTKVVHDLIATCPKDIFGIKSWCSIGGEYPIIGGGALKYPIYVMLDFLFHD